MKPQLARKLAQSDMHRVRYPLAVQPKINGIRCIWRDGNAYARSQKLIPCIWLREELRAIVEKAHPIFRSLDGEIQCGGSLNETQRNVRSVNASGFDFIWHVFDTQGDKPFSRRHDVLDVMVRVMSDARVKVVPYRLAHSESELMALHAANIQDPTLDGSIARNPSSVYREGRSTLKGQEAWKLKEFDDDEAVIIGFVERMHNTNDAQTNELGRTFRSSAKAGKVGTGSLGAWLCEWRGVEFKAAPTGDMERRKMLWETRADHLGKSVRFSHMGTGANGRPIHPVARGFRDAYDMGVKND